MRKLNRIAASAMAVVMAGSMMAGCSSSSSDNKSTSASTETKAPAASEDATKDATKDAGTEAPAAEVKQPEVSSTGKKLNIWCWNNEFATRMMLLPGYEVNDKKTPEDGGKLGDVEVSFTMVDNKDNAYQDALDAALDKQADASADDKVDLFLVEADYALKYVDDDCSDDVYKYIAKESTSDMFQYTKDVMTSADGVLKGVSWQGCPGLLFYNRDIAKDVLGTDDPTEVQKYVSDWDKFNETAQKMVEKKYYMVPSVNDAFRVYQNNVTSKWVDDSKNLVIDDNLKAWAESSKALYDMKATTNDELWAGYDNAKNGGCFCAFGPAWLINFCFGYDADKVKDGTADMTNVANAGKWGACVGPQSFNWGGTWMVPATGTDNAAEIQKIMLALTCDASVMKSIVTTYDDFVNNQKAMEEMANDKSYSSYILGGMNPLGLYLEGAKKISMKNITIYDQGCNEEFQTAMKGYFAGDSSYDEAIASFKKNLKSKYPGINVD